MDKAHEFETEVLRRLDDAEAKTGYVFWGLRRLIQERGAVLAAIHLLDMSNLSYQPEGFLVLINASLLQNSIEQAVLDFSEEGLFPSSILASARARLLIARNRARRIANAEGP